MIDILVLTLIFLVFILASYEDIKKREVYDYLNYFLVFALLSLSIADSIISNSIDPIKFVGFGLLVGFALGSMLYYFGIWGGGDAKFLIGFSASSYYIMNFINLGEYGTIFENIFFTIKNLTTTSMEYFLQIITIFDMIFLTIVGIFVIFSRNEKLRFERMFLFSILFLLFSGIYFNLDTIYLVLIGFSAFILIFFAPESVFESVFIKTKKFISELKQGDRLDGEIKNKNKILIDEENATTGISSGEIALLKDIFGKGKELLTRFVFPFGMLIALNYIVYIIRIISLSRENVAIISFMLKYLFISFIIGGILALLIIFYTIIKNHKDLNLKLKRSEKMIFLLSLLLVTTITIVDSRFAILYLLLLLYLIVKVGKDVEKFIFVKKKKISDIVPGDWVFEDVIVNNKLIFKMEDFKLGINEKQIDKINSLSKKHKNFKSLYVKDGIAFLPPLFLGFIIIMLI